jgi:hypothetical protein
MNHGSHFPVAPFGANDVNTFTVCIVSLIRTDRFPCLQQEASERIRQSDCQQVGIAEGKSMSIAGVDG